MMRDAGMKFEFIEKVYYWIAINQRYISLCDVALPNTPRVSPTPELLLGFPTLDEARLARTIFLTSNTIKEAIEEMIKAKLKLGAVIMKDPEPPTNGPMCWTMPGIG